MLTPASFSQDFPALVPQRVVGDRVPPLRPDSRAPGRSTQVTSARSAPLARPSSGLAPTLARASVPSADRAADRGRGAAAENCVGARGRPYRSGEGGRGRAAPGRTRSGEVAAARIAGTAEGTPAGAQDAAGCTGAAMVRTQRRDHQSRGPPRRPRRGSGISNQWANRNRAGHRAGQCGASPQGWAGPDPGDPMEVGGRVRPTSRAAGVGIGEKRSVELPIVPQPCCGQVPSGSQRKSPIPTPPFCCQTGPLEDPAPRGLVSYVPVVVI